MTFRDTRATSHPVFVGRPCDAGWVYAVQLAYCVALVFTNPVQMFPAIRIIENGLTPAVFHAGRPTKKRKWYVRQRRCRTRPCVAAGC